MDNDAASCDDKQHHSVHECRWVNCNIHRHKAKRMREYPITVMSSVWRRIRKPRNPIGEPVELIYKGRQIMQGVAPGGEPMLHFYETVTNHYGMIYTNETERLLAAVELKNGIDYRDRNKT